ncbi:MULTISPECIES: TetR/AcrR family transcriptional regulator [Bradyrhizobium]|uniref:TetR/AcrR family transcriptional regulator n=1 Tax=Bradyrhizobium TaxID=374 RepID=UPI000480D183|nr:MULTISPECIES: TetR/AcrR family transcriptional regulator [Bradyrhizobium]WLB86836.1 TetR/AcrR family transcriptional regulator [Bradyrhizobium japonicum USDA 135]GLR95235.1 TetR family transcriptional regulator [Bradyrhizobium liaoningense]
MGHSQAEKTQTHDEIVRIASKRFRELGLDGLSIADLMKEAGLTHGGFYRHFASREDLLLEALLAALKDGEAPGKNKREKANVALTFDAVIDGYLSESHRDEPGSGCAVSALMSDMGRAGAAARKLYTGQVERNLRLLTQLLGKADTPMNQAEAIVVYSAMIGAVGLARAVSDKRLSKEILNTVREYLKNGFKQCSRSV